MAMNAALELCGGMTNNATKFDVVILGLGTTGLSCARFYSDRNVSIAIMDSRSQPPGLAAVRSSYPEIPLLLGPFAESVLQTAGEIIISPGIAASSEPAIRNAMRAGVSVVGDIEIFCRHARRPVLAVTGSNGKSTVASLVHRMIEASGRSAKLGGNIGIPALDLLQGEEPEFYVLELSSFQLETTYSLDAAAATVLNISEDHMDRYANLQEYAIAKFRIFDGTGTMVINIDDKLVAAFPRSDRRHICFTTGVPGRNEFGVRERGGDLVLALGETVLCPVRDLPLHGTHNISNILAALAMGSAIGLPVPGMLDGLRSFPGLPHRCQWLCQINGVDWYNDSKGTNVGACCAAIKGLAGENNVILIAGGDGKDADFSPLKTIASGRVRTAILIGRDAELLAEVLRDVTEIHYAVDMEEAVNRAHVLSRPRDIVLLSPACSSLDMYTDYQQRGSVFAEAVARIAHV
jgi:UDP-N-acetylmuramoylalanine--D-glutamate ligase